MKKIVTLCFSLLLTFCLVIGLPIEVKAASLGNLEGLEVSLQTDKDTYAKNEEISVAISIKNTNTFEVTGVSIETLLPEGLKIKSGNLNFTDITIRAGETYSTRVTVEMESVSAVITPEESNPSDDSTNLPNTGDNSHVVLWVLLLIISCGGIVLAAKNRKKAMKLLSVLLCVTILATELPLAVFAKENNKVSLTVDKTITADGQEYTIKSTVSYVEVKYVVNFESNGGNIVAPQVIKKGMTVTEPEVPVLEGYQFVGWYTDKELTKSYDFKTLVTADMNLYAKWEDIKVYYTVDFESNGGSDVASQKIEAGKTTVEPESPMLNGYNFIGWYVDAEFTEKYDFTSPVDSDITLYAKWEKIVHYYTVTFETNGGSSVEKSIVEEGMKAAKPKEPFKEGYIFEGWYCDADFMTVYDFSNAVTADITLYAKWEETGSVYVTFMRNDGTNSAYQMQLVQKGGYVQRPEDPTMDLYRFVNWYTEPETVHEFKFDERITGNTILYAGWGDPDWDDSSLYAGNSGGGTTYSISGIEMSAGQAIVTVNTNDSAILVLRFYEDTEELFKGDFAEDANAPALLSEIAVRTPEYCEMVPIIVAVTDELPQYYYITADLYNDQGEKLCATFVDIEETARYEIFENKTIEDFNSEQVVQFSEDTKNNFGVLKETVKRVESTDVVNTLTVTMQAGVEGEIEGVESIEETNTVSSKTYTFSNVDESLRALQVGDTIYINGTSYLFKIASITEEDGKLIMTESEDVQLTDFYEFLKVDMDIVNEPTEDTPSTYEWNVADGESAFKLGYELHWKPKDWLELTGGMSVNGAIKLKIVYDFKLFADDYLYLETLVDVAFQINAGIEAKIDNESSVSSESKKMEIDFVKVEVPTPIAGLTIEIKPSVPIELEAKASLNFEYGNKLKTGFTYSSYDGKQDVDKKENAVKIYAQGEASAKIGPKLKIALAFCKSAFVAGLNASAGVKVEAKTNEIGGEFTNADSKHGCTLCVEAALKWYTEVYADVNYKIIKDVLEGEIGKWYIVKIEGNFPISPNFYVSVLNSDDSYFKGKVTFGWGNCPNDCYRTVFTIKDENGNEITGHPISVEKNDGTAVKNGESVYKIYLYDGAYTACTIIGGVAVNKSVVVSGDAQEIVLSPDSKDGNVYGKVLDSTNDNPVSGAAIIISQNGTNVAAAVSNPDGSYEVNLADGTYLIQTSKEGYRSFEEYVTISNDTTTYLQSTKLVPCEEEEKDRGGFSGRIVNNVTNEPIAGVVLKLRAGWNNPDQGDVIETLYTDENGEFRYSLRSLFGVSVGLEPGNYTLTASKNGYTTTTHNIIVVADIEKGDQGFSMSPILSEDEYRIVLSWGVAPTDLDSHLVAPVGDGEIFHLYYPYAEYNGSHSYSSYVTLDLDDVTSFGPETTTIHSPQEGKYYFYVHNFSGESSIVTSQAKVVVYHGDSSVTYNVPLNQGDGEYWNVFVLDTVANIITPINTISSVPHSGYSMEITTDEDENADALLGMIAEDIANSPKN